MVLWRFRSPNHHRPDQAVEAFARAIEAEIEIPVVLRTTALAPERSLMRARIGWRKRKAFLDAGRGDILQDYLDDGRERRMVVD